MKTISLFFLSLGNLAKRFFDKIAWLLYRPAPTEKDLIWNAFCKAGGESLRLDYNSLDADSIVFDLGGYEGSWASDIYSRYRSKIFIFEVYTPYYNGIKDRFAHNSDIAAYNYGLHSQNSTAQIAVDNFSTSAFKKTNETAEIDLKSISDFITENQIKRIHLMKINIEGGEYELLEYILSSGLAMIVENFQIQFHDFVPNAGLRMNSIRNKLSETHYPTYKFDFIWDNWRLTKL